MAVDLSARGLQKARQLARARTLREGRLHVGARVVVQIAARKRAG